MFAVRFCTFFAAIAFVASAATAATSQYPSALAQTLPLRTIDVDCNRQPLQQVLDENLDAPRLQLNVTGQCGSITIQRSFRDIFGSPSAVFDTITVSEGWGARLVNITIVGTGSEWEGLRIDPTAAAFLMQSKILFEPRGSASLVRVRRGYLSISGSSVASPIRVEDKGGLFLNASQVVSEAGPTIAVGSQSSIDIRASRIIRKNYQPYPSDCQCEVVSLGWQSRLDSGPRAEYRGRILVRNQSLATFFRSKLRGELRVHGSSDVKLLRENSYRGKSMVVGARSLIHVENGDDVLGNARCLPGGRITGQTAGLVLTDCPLP